MCLPVDWGKSQEVSADPWTPTRLPLHALPPGPCQLLLETSPPYFGEQDWSRCARLRPGLQGFAAFTQITVSPANSASPHSASREDKCL